jgi:MFS family permease
MGAVALDAANRFDTNAKQLASLAVIQLVFYASMQIPVGILLDRFGARKLLAVGAALMAIGQITVGFSTALAGGVVGRSLVGMGDAFTFISMIRLANSWVKGPKASQLQQWLSTSGQLGQILSAFPFALWLHIGGWESAFIGVGAVSILVAIVAFIFAHEPIEPKHGQKPNTRQVVAALRANAKRPITWVAFFTHFTTQSSGTTFALLWGIPFMVGALSLDHAFAASVLVVMVVTNSSMGPVIGYFCARWPHFRVRFVVSVVGAIAAIWVVILFLPLATPAWLLIVLAIVIGVGGPSSMIAFDFSKEAIEPRELGAANGLINVGGFLASLTMMFLIGLVLDLNSDGDLYSLGNFRFAFTMQFVVLGIGLAGFLVSVSRARNTKTRFLV